MEEQKTEEHKKAAEEGVYQMLSELDLNKFGTTEENFKCLERLIREHSRETNGLVVQLDRVSAELKQEKEARKKDDEGLSERINKMFFRMTDKVIPELEACTSRLNKLDHKDCVTRFIKIERNVEKIMKNLAISPVSTPGSSPHGSPRKGK
ncbi:hypothetical protein ACQ4LE_000651 [Meloidogyne hapla]|uniref:DUF148 domain-containing protein n=1 Tax=Meloidogyne hapla TaxID=6305 RepID=A0A1I8BS92_MELHA